MTAEGRPADEHGLWGVVVEAEGLKGTRRLFLSLGAGEPTPAIFIIYLLVFMALALFVSVFLQTRSRGQPRS